eukprot:CAMPEP_0175911880 /NCGR_PEP_ID=MMETSP0108-20121206/8428_1 /TAXON_ID=195067 ORGANISM="Goniomonas pacifica, Strain CCMP1869" /NCGR_SAMPLE_ID=MMETSP0108 /ASSEMBLY_ACC=CAM_ASM_000204 /LENGTH=147 /DNA_ID=CAMNT_0017234153 /DNA_START=66 /DNA_END=509 /DNA_ORIENTATION=-
MVIRTTLLETGPATAADLWKQPAIQTHIKSKRHMYRMLQFLKSQDLVRVRPNPQSTKKHWTYHLEPKNSDPTWRFSIERRITYETSFADQRAEKREAREAKQNYWNEQVEIASAGLVDQYELWKLGKADVESLKNAGPADAAPQTNS